MLLVFLGRFTIVEKAYRRDKSNDTGNNDQKGVGSVAYVLLKHVYSILSPKIR